MPSGWPADADGGPNKMQHHRTVSVADFTALAAYLMVTAGIFLLPYPSERYWPNIKLLLLASGVLAGLSLAASALTVCLALYRPATGKLMWAAASAAALPMAVDLSLWALNVYRLPTVFVWGNLLGG